MTLGVQMTTDGVFDPTAHARLMQQVFEAVLAGDRAPVAPRTLVSESWQRSLAAHVDPDRRTPPVVLGEEDVPPLREAHPLNAVMPLLRSTPVSLADHAIHVRTLTNADEIRR